jgi:hypothetical protein
MMLNAVTKLVFSVIVSKENLKIGKYNVKVGAAAKKKPAKNAKKRKDSSSE